MQLAYKELQQTAMQSEDSLPVQAAGSETKEIVQFTTMEAKFVMSGVYQPFSNCRPSSPG